MLIYVEVAYAVYEGICIGAAIGPTVGNLISAVFTTICPDPSKLISSDAVKAKEEMPDLFEKINDLRDDILMYFTKAQDPIYGASAFGNNFGSTNFFVVNEDIANSIDADALHWVYKHEMGHIYYNHSFKVFLIAAVIKAITGCILYHLYTQLPWWVGLCLVYFQLQFDERIYHFVSIFFERQADDFAIEYSTDQELIGGRRFFQAINETHQSIKKIHKQAYPEISLTRVDDGMHPSDRDRVKKIEQEMYKRKMDVDALDTDADYLQAKEVIKEYEFKCIIDSLIKPLLEKQKLDSSKFDVEVNAFLEEKLSLA